MALGYSSFRRNVDLSLSQKILQVNWGLVLTVAVIGALGVVMLYSAAQGSMDPWASRQLIRLFAGLLLMLALALVDIRVWFRYAYLIYFATLAMLLAVELGGSIGMGAQRWLNLGFVQIQPSEIMKLALILALARYFHGLSQEDVGRPHFLLLPLLLIFAGAGLVLKQPDLGTAGVLILIGGALFFAAGVRLWKFAVVLVGGLSAIPIAWQFLHEYQRARIKTFLDPERDPLGAGYHILQSKIALGSGGLGGRGFLQCSQSYLNFLPEKHTDFIFTMLAEEFGLVGALAVLGLFLVIIAYGLAISLRARNHFGRLLALGITCHVFLYVFINVAMVTGLIPVVGVPLPLISYGGTALLAVMCSLGILMSVYVHRDIRISRRGLQGEE